MAARAASSARCQLASQEVAGPGCSGIPEAGVPAGGAVGGTVDGATLSNSTAAATSVDIRAWSAQWPGPWAMTMCRTPRATQQRGLRTGQARPASGDDHVGAVRRHELRRGQEVLVGGQGVRAAPGIGGRLGEHRPARLPGNGEQRLDIVVAVAADDNAALGPGDGQRQARRRVREPGPRLPVGTAVWRLGPVLVAWHVRGLRCRGAIGDRAIGDQRVAERQVQVDRAGKGACRARRLRVGLAGQRPPRRRRARPALRGRRGRRAPADSVAVQA